jgi:hypothetical protein
MRAEHRWRISDSRQGQKHSEETKGRISASGRATRQRLREEAAGWTSPDSQDGSLPAFMENARLRQVQETAGKGGRVVRAILVAGLWMVCENQA